MGVTSEGDTHCSDSRRAGPSRTTPARSANAHEGLVEGPLPFLRYRREQHQHPTLNGHTATNGPTSGPPRTKVPKAVAEAKSQGRFRPDSFEGIRCEEMPRRHRKMQRRTEPTTETVESKEDHRAICAPETCFLDATLYAWIREPLEGDELWQGP